MSNELARRKAAMLAADADPKHMEPWALNGPIRMVGLTPEQERLLGAAPELLAALCACLREDRGWQETAREAIARAEGRGA